MPKSLRCLTIALTDIPTEYKITLGYLTYHSGKLFNQALYLVKTKRAKINTYALYGRPIPKRHGYPLRLVVPPLYAWKSAKYV